MTEGEFLSCSFKQFLAFAVTGNSKTATDSGVRTSNVLIIVALQWLLASRARRACPQLDWGSAGQPRYQDAPTSSGAHGRPLKYRSPRAMFSEKLLPPQIVPPRS